MVTRREFLAAGAAAVGLAACKDGSPKPDTAGSTPAGAATPAATTGASTASGAQALSTAASGAPAAFVSAGRPGQNQIALTFHTAGTSARFHALVNVLRARRTPITAFIVGKWLEANLDLGKQLRDAGHELANHTYTHPSFAKLTATEMADEIARCRAAVAKINGDGGRWFRPSGTDDGVTPPSSSVLAAAGAGEYPTVVGYDIDSLDFKDPGADAVVSRTVGLLHDGAIVSLHFDHQGTIDALPRILDATAARGLKPVTLSTLLA